MAAPSFDDLFELGKAEMILRRPDLFLAPGDVTDFIVAAAAAMGDNCIHFAAEQFRKTFIDGAAGADLSALVDDHYSIQRQKATKAQVTVSFSRPTSGAGGGTLPIGFVVSTIEAANGERQEFALTSAAVFAGGDLGPKTATAEAVNAGRDGNVAAATILNLVGSHWDTSITVTNALPAAGGNDEESDIQYRERARAFPSTLRRGTLDALEFGALQVPSVRVATATEDEEGICTVFVTDEDGGSTLEMVADVIVELENWRCAGSIVNVVGGSVLLVNVTVVLTLVSGSTAADFSDAVSESIIARLAKLPVGDGTAESEGVLRREIIQAAAICVDHDRIIGVTVTLPAANVVPAAGQVIRAGVVTVG